ncbi:MAG: hypothetical protein K2I00_00895, partial [Ruminococcus sp.]|nr:hypothetical protein [Ruminococcus sp.]
YKGNKKIKKPKIRFNFGVFLLIFLLSFLICFVTYMFKANVDEMFFNEVEIASEENKLSSTIENDESDTILENLEYVSSLTYNEFNPVPQSEALDDSYFDDCCLITDSTFNSIINYDKFSQSNIFFSAELNAVSCMTTKIDSSFGNDNVYEIIKNKKPNILYIMLGSDISESSINDMINGYSNLVSNLHSVLPDMKIYVMQYPPALYDSETLSNSKINDYNTQLLTMCNNLGINCIDINTAMKSELGTLKENYWSNEKLTYSDECYLSVFDYILTHTR